MPPKTSPLNVKAPEYMRHLGPKCTNLFDIRHLTRMNKA